MEAIVLAGGLGERLRKIVNDLPKPMAPISGVPFLKILLNNLKKNGFKRVIISTFYKRDVIKDFFGTKYQGMSIIYTEEKSPLGTGGAIRYAMECCSKDNDHFYILNGDSFIEIDIKNTE